METTNIITKNATCFEAHVTRYKQDNKGNLEGIGATYIVEGDNFAEAEAAVMKKLKPLETEWFKIDCIKRVVYQEIILSKHNYDDKWYKVKLRVAAVDKDTKKATCSYPIYLIQAKTASTAFKYTEEFRKDTEAAYSVVAVQEINI